MRSSPSDEAGSTCPVTEGITPLQMAGLRRARSILDGLDEAFFALDSDWRLTYVNDEAARITARPREDLVGRPMMELLPEWMRAEFAEHFGRAMRERTAVHFETATTRSRWFDVHVHPAPDGLLAHCCEITDRKRAEEAVRESEARYRRLIETCYEGVWTIDAGGKTDFVNQRAAEMLGCEPEDMLGSDPLDFVPPEDAEIARRHISRHRYGANVRLAVRMRRKDGTDIWTRVVTSPIFGEAGEYLGALAMFTDITEQHRAEAAREELLRQLVTVQEDERRRIALALHDQTGQYLAALSLGLKALEHNLQSDAPALKRLRGLQAVTRQLGGDVRRIASALHPPMLSELGLAQAVRSYASEWSSQFGIAVDTHITGLDGERLPSLVEIAVYRVSQEALTNIARHASARNASLVLERHANLLQCIVEDDGVGFDAEAFYASGNGGAQRGLWGARERAKLLGGTLTVESVPGKGTTVFLRIPIPEGRSETRHG